VHKVEEKLYLGLREHKRLNTTVLDHWFSNGAPQEVAKRATNIMKVYFKN
jgi:hypothetical protein